jgi:dinuclear metal center YbgI/SA1388 family protein
MKVSDIIEIIERTAPLSAAAGWDASGVQVAALREEATTIAVTLDPSLASLRQAADSGADFVLAHHPLSLQPRFPNRRDDYLAILSLLFTRGMWLYSAHTSLDANPEGPARWLAGSLGMESLELLEPLGQVGPDAPQYGFGFTGALPESLAYRDFCQRLASALRKEEWQVCGPVPGQVRRVACCPGSGGDMLGSALASGADLLVTGDVKYHAALDARAFGLRVIDVGHFVLEEEMMRLFAGQLAAGLGIPVIFIPGRDPLQGERVAIE